MSGDRRRLGTLVGLVVLLAAWIALQFRYSDQARALYMRQALTVHAVTVQGADTTTTWPDGTEVTSETVSPWRTALAPRLDMVASCLMTDAGSRAPVVLRITGSAPTSVTLLDGEGTPMDPELVQCVGEAIEPAEWPDETVQHVEFVLADLRLTTRRDMALARVTGRSAAR